MHARTSARAFGFWVAVVAVLAITGFDPRPPPPDPPSIPAPEAAIDDPAGELAIKDRTYLPETPLRGPPNLTGTVVVVDEAGEEHHGLDGEFMLVQWRGQRGQGTTVKVKDGRFETRIEADGLLAFSNVTLGNRPAHVEGRLEVPADGTLTVRALWHRRVVLRVVEDATGRDLDGLVVKQVWQGSSPLHLVHPGTEIPLRPYTLDGTSPLLLPDSDQAHTYWVHAPGYAWAQVVVDHMRDREKTLRLVPGGACTLVLKNRPEGRPLLVSFHAPGERPPVLHARPDPEGRCPVESLRPGAYAVRVALEKMPEAGPLAEGEVTVVAGGTAKLDLAVADAPPAHPEARFEGTLVVAPGWDGASPGMRFGRADESDRTALYLRDGTWKAGTVRTGRYVVEVSPFGVLQVFDVGPLGLTDAVVTVPLPADVEVGVLDPQGEPLEAEVRWSPAPPQGVRSRPAYEAKRVSAGLYRFRAAEGELELTVHVDGATVHTERFVAEMGPNRKVVEVARRAVLRIRLMDGDRPLPIPSNYFPVAVGTEEGAPEADQFVHDGESVRVVARRPGRYRISLPAPDGYKPIPPRTMDLPAGETALDVPVERE